MATTLDLSGKTVTLPAASVTAHVTQFDDNQLKEEIALLGFRTAANGSLAKYNLVDQTIDVFEDASGVDSSASTNDGRNATGNYYSGAVTDPPAGGTITYANGKTIQTFNTADNGTSTNVWTPTSSSSAIEYLVLAGAGGGGTSGDNGSSQGGGGGGAGGYRIGTGFSVTAQAYTIVAGAGGDGAPWGTARGTKGTDSTFSTITSTGGGGGGTKQGTRSGEAGGSGGGGAREGTGGAGNTPSTTPSQGNPGGPGYSGLSGAGGGGGAGGTGATGGAGPGGAGGIGLNNSISGATVGYAGGGGGGNGHPGGAGGTGTSGGGNGATNGQNGFAGTDGLGGGGGGGCWGSSGYGDGGDGGNGVVILSYPDGTFTTHNAMTLQSNATTAQAIPTKGDLVMTYSDGAGTATINTDLKAYASRDNGTTWTQLTLASQGSTGAHTILSAHDLDISGQPSGTAMRYKITTHNQSTTKETRIHAVSLGWS
jgi:hypothetical protein